MAEMTEQERRYLEDSYLSDSGAPVPVGFQEGGMAKAVPAMKKFTETSAGKALDYVPGILRAGVLGTAGQIKDIATGQNETPWIQEMGKALAAQPQPGTKYAERLLPGISDEAIAGNRLNISPKDVAGFGLDTASQIAGPALLAKLAKGALKTARSAGALAHIRMTPNMAQSLGEEGTKKVVDRLYSEKAMKFGQKIDKTVSRLENILQNSAAPDLSDFRSELSKAGEGVDEDVFFKKLDDAAAKVNSTIANDTDRNAAIKIIEGVKEQRGYKPNMSGRPRGSPELLKRTLKPVGTIGEKDITDYGAGLTQKGTRFSDKFNNPNERWVPNEMDAGLTIQERTGPYPSGIKSSKEVPITTYSTPDIKRVTTPPPGLRYVEERIPAVPAARSIPIDESSQILTDIANHINWRAPELKGKNKAITSVWAAGRNAEKEVLSPENLSKYEQKLSRYSELSDLLKAGERTQSLEGGGLVGKLGDIAVAQEAVRDIPAGRFEKLLLVPARMATKGRVSSSLGVTANALLDPRVQKLGKGIKIGAQAAPSIWDTISLLNNGETNE